MVVCDDGDGDVGLVVVAVCDRADAAHDDAGVAVLVLSVVWDLPDHVHLLDLPVYVHPGLLLFFLPDLPVRLLFCLLDS